MKYSKSELKKKTKKELIEIILKLIDDPLNNNILCIIADGIQGMRRGG